MFLVSLYGLEVAFRRHKINKLDSILRNNKRYSTPEDLFSKRELRVFRRTFSYFDHDLIGSADVSHIPLFQGKSKLLFSVYLHNIHQARLEGRQAEVSKFIKDAETQANARQGDSIFFFLLLFSFIILIGTSSTIFEYFQCEAFEEVEPAVSYLVRDYSLNCASSRYIIYVVYAVAMLFVYPLG